MSFLTEWLLSIIGTAFLVALAEALMPEDRIREVGRLVGGILILLALLSPLRDLDVGRWELSYQAYLNQIDQKIEEYQQEQNNASKSFIKENLEAYIENTALELGVPVHAEIILETGTDGLAKPGRVEIDMPYHRTLADVIVRDLGIPEEQQIWNTEQGG